MPSTSPRLSREASRDTALRRRCRLKSNCASVWGSPVSRAMALPGVPPAAQVALEGAYVALAARPRRRPGRAAELAAAGRPAQQGPAVLATLGQVVVGHDRGHEPAHVAGLTGLAELPPVEAREPARVGPDRRPELARHVREAP